MRSRIVIEAVLISVVVAIVLLSLRLNEIAPSVVRFFTGRSFDPATIHLEGEFVESNLGAAQEPDGSITLRMIAQQYVFVPRCVRVPANVPIHLRITSADAVHKLTVDDNDVEVVTGPGSVSHAELRFARPGTYGMPCHHYCGAGHYAMKGELVVVPADVFGKIPREQRVSCATP